MFHTQKKVNDSLRSSNPWKITFARMLSSACIEISKTLQTHVLKHYKEKEKGTNGKPDEALMIEMMSNHSYKRKIYNHVPDRRKLRDNVAAVMTVMTGKDSSAKIEAEDASDYY